MGCLALLYIKGISTPTELAKYTGLSSGATTAMLDRLERAKLIIRKPNPTDRRGVWISADENSKATVGPLFASTRAAQNELLSRYSMQELELLADFFGKLTNIWEKGREQLPESLDA